MTRAIGTTRRVLVLLVCSILPWLASTARGQASPDYPSRSIRFIVPHTPGGLADSFARALAQHLSESLGRPVVVDNRPGASQMIGAELASKAAPDGYTIFLGTQASLIMNTILQERVRYDAVRDFTPISLLFTTTLYLMVHSSVPARSVQELVALARAQPGKLSYASIGVGTSSHLAMELFKNTMAIDILHVPYKGNGPATTDLLAGHVNMMFGVSALSSGKLRVLAYAGRKRTAAMPDLPTMSEAGVPDFDVTSWFAVLGPAGMPRPIVERLNRETLVMLRARATRDRASTDGIELTPSTPEELGERIRTDIPYWTRVVRDIGISPK